MSGGGRKSLRPGPRRRRKRGTTHAQSRTTSRRTYRSRPEGLAATPATVRNADRSEKSGTRSASYRVEERVGRRRVRTLPDIDWLGERGAWTVTGFVTERRGDRELWHALAQTGSQAPARHAPARNPLDSARLPERRVRTAVRRSSSRTVPSGRLGECGEKRSETEPRRVRGRAIPSTGPQPVDVQAIQSPS